MKTKQQILTIIRLKWEYGWYFSSKNYLKEETIIKVVADYFLLSWLFQLYVAPASNSVPHLETSWTPLKLVGKTDEFTNRSLVNERLHWLNVFSTVLQRYLFLISIKVKRIVSW